MAIDEARGGVRGRRPSNRGAAYSRVSRGVEIQQQWPRKRGKNLHPKTKAQMEFFRQIQWAFKFSDALVQRSYSEAVAKTPFMPRDLFLMAASGRMHFLITPDGKRMVSTAAQKSISDSIDILAPVPGQMLFRGPVIWEPITPGTAGQVLSSTGELTAPAWIDPSGSGNWGEITGDIEDQTDLQDEFALKLTIADDSVTWGPGAERFEGPALSIKEPDPLKGAATFGAGIDNSSGFLEFDLAGFTGGAWLQIDAATPNRCTFHCYGSVVGFDFQDRPTYGGDDLLIASDLPSYAIFDATHDGFAPASGGGAVHYLRADGNWATPPGTVPGVFDATHDGLTPASGGGAVKYLRADGAWVAPTGTTPNLEAALTMPVAADFTLLNGAAGTNPATLGNYGAGVDVYQALTPGGTNQVRFAKFNTAPAGGGFTLTARMSPIDPGNAFGQAGQRCLILRNATNGRMILFGEGGTGTILYVQILSSYTSGSLGQYTSFSAAYRFPWMRIVSDGTNLTFWVSVDGYTWVKAGAGTTIANYIGSVDECGIGCQANAAGVTLGTHCQSFTLV